VASEWMLSADSHVIEPPELWERVDAAYRDRVPRLVADEDADWIYLDDARLVSFTVGAQVGKRFEGLEHLKSSGRWQDVPPAAYQPSAYLDENETDGVWGAVIYPTVGFLLYTRVTDSGLLSALARAFNDWLAEFCAHDPQRLIGVGLYALDALPDVSEIERCAKKGLKGILILATETNDRPYSDERFDPLWRVCAELGMPISLHKPLVSGMPLTPAMPTMADLQIHVVHVVEGCITRLVYGGVFERFPKLKIVSAENDVGWIPNWVHRLDHVHSKMSFSRQLKQKPSEYVRRNVWATFQDDPLGPATWKFFGESNYMWASDFPHADSTFPDSLKVIDENFAGVPPEITRRIVFENANRLYGLGLS
jgi:predicted TIM-barrel fold metal-dependent hydrolase